MYLSLFGLELSDRDVVWVYGSGGTQQSQIHDYTLNTTYT